MEEKDYRRKDFAGGIPVVMIGGETWYFAEPRMRLIPSDSSLGFEQCLSLDDDGAFDQLVTEYHDLVFNPGGSVTEHGVKMVSLEMRIGRMMLERNYDIPLDKLRSIFQISHQKDDEVANNIRLAIYSVMEGDSPKPSAGGGEPSPTLPAGSASTTAC